MQRNNIACRYGRPRQARLVRWREVEGLMPGEIARRAAVEWPELPPIHSSTWQCWARSPEYVTLRTMVCEEAEADRPRDALWGAVQDGGMGPALQGTMYLLLRQAFDAAKGGTLEPAELTRLMTSLSAAQRADIAQRTEEKDTRIAAIEREHEAQVAEYEVEARELQAEVARLKAALSAAGVDPDAEPEAKAGGLSPAALKQIEEQAKLL